MDPNYEQLIKEFTKERNEFTKERNEFTKEGNEFTKERKECTKERKECTKERKEFLNAQRKIYRFVSEKPNISTTEMAERMGVSRRQVQKYIKRLTDMNLIVREGGRKIGTWRITDADYDSFFSPE